MHYHPGYVHCRTGVGSAGGTAAADGGDGGASSSVQQMPGGGGGVLGGTSNARWRGSTCGAPGSCGGGSGVGDNDDSGADSCTLSDDRDESDSNSGASALEPPDPQLPYPGIARLSMGYLTQTMRPRSWCLALITNPYPFLQQN